MNCPQRNGLAWRRAALHRGYDHPCLALTVPCRGAADRQQSLRAPGEAGGHGQRHGSHGPAPCPTLCCNNGPCPCPSLYRSQPCRAPCHAPVPSLGHGRAHGRAHCRHGNHGLDGSGSRGPGPGHSRLGRDGVRHVLYRDGCRRGRRHVSELMSHQACGSFHCDIPSQSHRAKLRCAATPAFGHRLGQWETEGFGQRRRPGSAQGESNRAPYRIQEWRGSLIS
mmetsp:Transcript_28568/g.80541  ORF Transcript_28568/g.80541 Transcript_28568/m.80541 type:complete len:223 (-) Transcript_28568:1320-1988(-)